MMRWWLPFLPGNLIRGHEWPAHARGGSLKVLGCIDDSTGCGMTCVAKSGQIFVWRASFLRRRHFGWRLPFLPRIANRGHEWLAHGRKVA